MSLFRRNKKVGVGEADMTAAVAHKQDKLIDDGVTSSIATSDYCTGTAPILILNETAGGSYGNGRFCEAELTGNSAASVNAGRIYRPATGTLEEVG